MKNFRRYAALTLGGVILAGSFSGCGKINRSSYKKMPETSILTQEERIIEEMPCLQFSEPVDAVKIGFVGSTEAGYTSDGTPIYLDKYIELEKTTTDLIIDGEMLVCMDFLSEDGKIITKQMNAYKNATDGALIIFPNGVVEQVEVGKDQVVYEVDGRQMIQEIPLYKSNLSFTTGQTVTEKNCTIDVTKENNYILLSDVEESMQR